MTRNVSDRATLVTETTPPRIVLAVPRQTSAQNVERVDVHLMCSNPGWIHLDAFFSRSKRAIGAIPLHQSRTRLTHAHRTLDRTTAKGRCRRLCDTALLAISVWACEELNLGPHAYQACALTT